MKPTDLIGDWMVFYQNMGVTSAALTGKHADCPLCGKANTFRTAIKTKPGVWVCSNCSSSEYSTGLEFIKRFCGFNDFFEVGAFIRKQVGAVNPAPVRATPTWTDPQADKAAFMKETQKRDWIWKTLAKPVTPGDPVWKYLTRRVPGIKSIPENIRYLPDAQYWEQDEDGKMVMTGKYPAMLVRGFDAQGNCVQLHTTYLTNDGYKASVKNPKKTKTSVGSSSFCFRLNDIGEDGKLGVAEGIETSLNCEVKFKHPVWPCHSNTVLANFEIPEGMIDHIELLVIYADNDGWRVKQNGERWNPGLSKARELAARMRKLKRSNGSRLKVLICYTSSVGDFAD